MLARVAFLLVLGCGVPFARAAVDGARNDCLIAVQDGRMFPLPSGTVVCLDGDPACDADGAEDGTCTIRVRGCFDMPGVPSCMPRPIRRFSFKPNRIVVAPPASGAAASVCGAFVDLEVPLRKNGRKPGRRKVVAKATANVTPYGRNTDRDVIVFECGPASCPGCSTTTTPTSTTRPPTTAVASTTVPTTSTTTTAPLATCGNNVIEPGETCDGTALGDPAPACLHGGAMGCHGDCKLDDSGCFACANGEREGPEIGGSEECDGNDIGTAVCADGQGGPYHGGTPGCSASCQLDFGHAHCWRCGDAHRQGDEECDAGAGNGTPQNNCDANCQLRCGDGIVQQGEQCDDGGTVGGDGCASMCLFEGGATYEGGTQGDTCAVDAPACVDGCYAVWGVAGIDAPTPTMTCMDGAACDADGAVNAKCTMHYFYCLNEADTVGPGSPQPPCFPRDVKRVALVTPPTDLDGSDGGAFLDSVEGVLGRFDGVTMRDADGVTRTARLNRGGVCGDSRATVPAGESRILAVTITDSGNPADSGTNPRTDHDELVFECLPAS